MIRRYEIKRLDQANVERSLRGAAGRAKDGYVVIAFCTKSERLPDDLDQHKIPDGGAYIEAYSNGEFRGGYLIFIASGYDENNGYFEKEMGIKLGEIDGLLGVNYEVDPETLPITITEKGGSHG